MGSAAEPARRRQGFSQRIAVLLILAVMVGQGLILASSLPGRSSKWDFSLFYLPALELRNHVNPYTTNLAPLAARMGMVVPSKVPLGMPTFFLLFEPLTLLRPVAAYRVWMGLNVAALAAVPWALTAGEMSPAGSWAFAACVLSYFPVTANLIFAQSQILVLLFLAMIMRCLRARYDRSAGLMLALVSLLRGFPALVTVYLLFRRRWTALWYTALAILLGGLATFALAPETLTFFRATEVVTTDVHRSILLNLSLSTFFWRLIPWGVLPIDRRLGVGVLALASQAALIAFAARATVKTSDEGAAFGLWVATSVIVSPVVWGHYMAVLLLPFSRFAVATETRRLGGRVLAAAVASYVLISAWPLLMVVFQHEATVTIVAETGLVSLFAAYLAAYWFALEPAAEFAQSRSGVAAAGEPLRKVEGSA